MPEYTWLGHWDGVAGCPVKSWLPMPRTTCLWCLLIRLIYLLYHRATVSSYIYIINDNIFYVHDSLISTSTSRCHAPLALVSPHSTHRATVSSYIYHHSGPQSVLWRDEENIARIANAVQCHN